MLEALADHCGSGLLRLKGIVNVAECPDRPAVIHGVQHVFHAPTWLGRWPGDDRSTRLALIGHGLSDTWIRCLIAALESELDEIGAKAQALAPMFSHTSLRWRWHLLEIGDVGRRHVPSWLVFDVDHALGLEPFVVVDRAD